MTEERFTTRLAVDIGGTFTDVVLEVGEELVTTKVRTTADAPAEAVLEGTRHVLAEAQVPPEQVGVFVHGTTLATNAIIERRGATTALLTTEGFRDSVEIAHENRFEQYDVFMDKPAPLVPRQRRYGVPERIGADGRTLRPLDEEAVRALTPELAATGVEAVAVGYLHSYAHPDHERRTRDVLLAELPELHVTLSSDVCPEIREYERLSTACANAYVQPLMSRYLSELDLGIRQLGLSCPFFVMQSGGGIATLEAAIAQPIRLVESGPAGGAILAAHLAGECGLGDLLSFDMGGTTAKLCLIENGEPATAREFEVARVYRFLKGSGLPLRIPVIEMVEIGAGGGSVAAVDSLGRIGVGPESAAGDPGPACYGLGGDRPTVTDADVQLGRLDPTAFAGGTLPLDATAAASALRAAVGEPLGVDDTTAAVGVTEIVDENMANAARVHAIEQGRDVAGGAMVAFGGAAPLHAARLADRLGIDQVLVPSGAGVGSAIGFLRAAVSHEAVRSLYQRLSQLDVAAINLTLDELTDEAYKIVQTAAPGAATHEIAHAFMRYLGQGHEIAVSIPAGGLSGDVAGALKEAFETEYRRLFRRTIDELDIEIMSWVVSVATDRPIATVTGEVEPADPPPPASMRRLVDPADGSVGDAAVWRRESLDPGAVIAGPAVIEEDQTTTIVPAYFTARVDGRGYLVLTRNPGEGDR